jgi:hypothetical protein
MQHIVFAILPEKTARNVINHATTSNERWLSILIVVLAEFLPGKFT